MAQEMKPAVGRQGVNAAAEASARSPNLESGTLLDKVTDKENMKRNEPHFGHMPKSGQNQGVR